MSVIEYTVVKLHNQGFGTARIADEVGISEAKVIQILEDRHLI